MADNRDYRVRMDLTFPPEVKQHAEEVRDMLIQLYTHAVVINEGENNEERGFIAIERCGHRINEACDIIAKWEVGKGQVIKCLGKV